MAGLTRPEWRAYLAVSLDGFIARPDGSVDWLEPFDAGAAGFEAFLAGVDAIAMGRGTYDAVRRMGPWPYGGRPTAVVTGRPLDDRPPSGVRPAPDVPTAIAALDGTARGRVWVAGGGRLIAALAACGRLDALELWIALVVLGEGIPLFAPGFPRRTVSLETAAPGPAGLARLVCRL